MRLILILFCWSLVLSLFGQVRNLGMPFIQSFSKADYQAAPQNSDITQDSRGVVYFANNKGLLAYNGTAWKTYPLPNRTIVRSIAAHQARIYTGGQNEFGFFQPNQGGDWEFQSLKERIPEEHRSFEDVWDIHIVAETVYFRSSSKIFCYRQEVFEVFEQGDLNFLATVNGIIYVQDLQRGLFILKENGLEKIAGSEFLQKKIVSGIVPTPHTLLIMTREQGIFQYDGQTFSPFLTTADAFLRQNQINGVIAINQKYLAIGTDFGGLLLMNEQGEGIYHLDKQNNLLNNRILSLYTDHSHNLWVGLENGINYIEINSPFTQIIPDGTLEGTGYDVQVYEDQIYFCTSNGLYAAPWKNRYNPLQEAEFQLITNSKGLAWGLDVVDDQLFLGHHKGAFQVIAGSAINIAEGAGVWNFTPLQGQEDLLVAGTYNNLQIFTKDNSLWNTRNKLSSINESCRFVEQDNQGNIWVAHPYKGIFKISPSPDFKTATVENFGEAAGLPSLLLNHLFKIKDEIIFCAEKGVYTFDYQSNTFQPSAVFNEMFGAETKIRRLFETPEGNIWYVTETELGLIEILDKGLERHFNKKVFPNLSQNLNQGFEKIYAFDKNNVFFTNDKGFLHYHPNTIKQDTLPLQVVFTAVKLTNEQDSILFEGVYNNESELAGSPNEITTLNFQQNAIQFGFSATDYTDQGAWKYRYFLEGEESEWSIWKTEKDKEYNHLSAGTYQFHVQALHPDGRESEVLSYRFEILPPWYWSSTAKLLYLLVGIGLIALLILPFLKEFRSLKAENKQVVQESQVAIDKLQSEKTEAELQHKQRELVSTTMHLVQKNERLEDIKTRLIEIEKNTTEKPIAKELRALVRGLQQDEILDEGWEQFMLHFNQLHGNYFDRLKENYPELTPKDLKLCAYLRMNLSTKEMASLMNITVRGVEASRYRLRKKFELNPDDNLTSFLMHY